MLKPNTEFTYSSKAAVLAAYDVVVAGGGTAGCVAALAAARNGAKTLLIERCGYLGGMITAGNAGLTMYTRFSGDTKEHARDQETLRSKPEDIQLVGGIVKEIAERLISSGVGIGNAGTFGSYIFTSSEDLKRLLFQMMNESKVNLRLHSWVSDVIKEGDTIEGVVVESKSGRQIIPAALFIDATGDGDLAARAGVPFTVGVTEADYCAKEAKVGGMMVMGVMFKAGNVDLKRTFEWLEQNPAHFAKQPFARFTLGEAKANFEKGEMATLNILSDKPPKGFQVYNLPAKGVVTLCCPCVSDMDGCNVEHLTRAELLMADLVERWMSGIREIPGFENAFLLDIPEMGVRETRHIEGDYILTIDDIYKQTPFDDCIGFGSHPIDAMPRPQWLMDPETAYPPRWFFHIPFRSCIAKGIDNLLVAGRCISATHEAFGCIRPTVQCMMIGEAAGTAAAMCAGKSMRVRELPHAELRARLIAQGVRC